MRRPNLSYFIEYLFYFTYYNFTYYVEKVEICWYTTYTTDLDKLRIDNENIFSINSWYKLYQNTPFEDDISSWVSCIDSGFIEYTYTSYCPSILSLNYCCLQIYTVLLLLYILIVPLNYLVPPIIIYPKINDWIE